MEDLNYTREQSEIAFSYVKQGNAHSSNGKYNEANEF